MTAHDLKILIISIAFATSLISINTYGDDDSTLVEDDLWTVEIVDRVDNSLGTVAEEDTLFGIQDCMDNVGFDIEVSLSDTALALDGDLYLYIGEECDDDDEIGDCTIMGETSLSSASTITFSDIAFEDVFFATECEGGDRESIYLWLAILEDEGVVDDDGDDEVEHIATLIFDGTGPNATVTIDEIYVGDNNVEIDFDASDASSVAGYIAVYVKSGDNTCSDAALTEGERFTAEGIDGTVICDSADDNTMSITGLENGANYYVAIATLDEYGNPSVLSAGSCVSPAESVGIGETIHTDGEYCFIATAAFGSYDHPVVQRLRNFRDHFLVYLPFGKAFVAAYFRVGPTLAQYVEKDAVLRKSLQDALHLFSGMSLLLVAIGPTKVKWAVALALLLGLGLGMTMPMKTDFRA